MSAHVVRAWRVLLLVALIVSACAWRVSLAPSFLREGSRSRWIRAPQAHYQLQAQRQRESVTEFRGTFETSITRRSAPATLFVRGEARLELDGRLLQLEHGPAGELRARLECEPGMHAIRCVVLRADGPPVLRLEAPEFGLFSDENWACDPGGGGAALCSEPSLPDIALAGPTVSRVVRDQIVVLLAWLLGLATAIHLIRFRVARYIGRAPAGLRWVLLLTIGALSLHNFASLPVGLGMDVAGHVEYVRLLVERGRLPMPHDGWQCHQGPLFYVLSAPFQWLAGLAGARPAEVWLRVLPLVCCTLQVEVLYRIAKRAFAQDPILQLVLIWIGSLFPMQLAMGQFASNEPLLGLLGSLIVWRCVCWIVDRPRPLRLFDVGSAGFLVGAAALTKVTGLLFVPIVGLTLIFCQRGTTSRAILVRSGLFLATFALTASWWYAWTWTRTGHWIVMPWHSDVTGLAWWQEPGNRTQAEFLRFGRALARPFYSSTAGFWDGLYSCAWMDGALSGSLALPPWRYSPMYVCAWLAVPLTIAGVHGMVRSRSGTERCLQLFATCACALFGLSILESFLRMPCYSSGKPTYALGLLACFAMLIAIGSRPLLARPIVGEFAGAWIVLFGGCSYAAFWSI